MWPCFVIDINQINKVFFVAQKEKILRQLLNNKTANKGGFIASIN